jgi:hypothetical protein
MNRDKLKEFFSKCELNLPVEKPVVDEFQEDAGTELPDAYAEFLQFSNGAEGALGNGSYVQMWKAEELTELNESYRVKEFAPGMLLIGSGGGDEAIGIDLRKGSQTYGSFYKIPFIPLDWDKAILLGPEITDIKII